MKTSFSLFSSGTEFLSLAQSSQTDAGHEVDFLVLTGILIGGLQALSEDLKDKSAAAMLVD